MRVSPHTQFWIVTLLSLFITFPFVALAWRQHAPDLRLMLAMYVAGYGLIVGTLIVDSFINPPLVLHGFFPGIGCGLIVVAFGVYASGSLATRKPPMRAGES